jgi:class 3 adenylate cyclase/alpha-beta hydrolase superfamily lysophospholipase
MQPPDTEFAHCGDIQIAYQVYGSGPAELVLCGGPAGHVECYWEEPLIHRWYERLGSFARVAIFDRRGTGASDSTADPPTDEQYMDDLAAVIEAAGFTRPALVGAVEASRMCALFAATYPDRISALVLVDTAAAGRKVLSDEQVRWLQRLIEERWGKEDMSVLYAPTMRHNERFQRWFARMTRLAVSPQGARRILDLALQSDVTDALPRIQSPTLVIHHRDNSLVPVELGRSVAKAIPKARFVEVAGQDSMMWLGDADAILGEIEEFLTGARRLAPCGELAAVLFTDIVGSTERAAELRHEQWQQLLSEHDDVVRRQIELCGGAAIKAIGDGFLATFDTPDQAVRAGEHAIAAAEPLGLELRVGIHVGAVERLRDDVRGLAVHIAARIIELARPGQVLVSQTVKDILIDSPFALEPVREQPLRGVPGRWVLYEVKPRSGAGGERPQREAAEPAPDIERPGGRSVQRAAFGSRRSQGASSSAGARPRRSGAVTSG